MGFLLSWWSLLVANCSGGGSSGLPPRPWTVTSKPWLLLSSSVQSRTWGTKPVSPWHHRPGQAPRWCPHGRCPASRPSALSAAGQREPGPPLPPPWPHSVSQPWEGAVLLWGLRHRGHRGRSQHQRYLWSSRTGLGQDGAAPPGLLAGLFLTTPPRGCIPATLLQRLQVGNCIGALMAAGSEMG